MLKNDLFFPVILAHKQWGFEKLLKTSCIWKFISKLNKKIEYIKSTLYHLYSPFLFIQPQLNAHLLCEVCCWNVNFIRTYEHRTYS